MDGGLGEVERMVGIEIGFDFESKLGGGGVVFLAILIVLLLNTVSC